MEGRRDQISMYICPENILRYSFHPKNVQPRSLLATAFSSQSYLRQLYYPTVIDVTTLQIPIILLVLKKSFDDRYSIERDNR
jgi:hypothetical protein